jgi:hydrogenase small subunit
MNDDTLLAYLKARGVSRRGFLKFCVATTSMLGLAPSMVREVAAALAQARRPSVIWLSFQECTGCTESLTRSHSPTLEGLILNAISLDYHHTLMAASGDAAERAREAAMKENWGNYLVLVDGSVPTGDHEYFSTIAGHSNLQILKETVKGAAAVINVGTCAAYGGIPAARPNPTGAKPTGEILNADPETAGKPIINVPGCPPIPAVITGVVAHYLTFGSVPELDSLGRPLAFYGDTIHDRCYRRPFYDQGKFAKTFDDEGARRGWCLFELGCRGPTTRNACATTKWNQGTSFPIQSGHGCIGCSEPNFWDTGSFYKAISVPTEPVAFAAGVAIAAGAAAGVGMAMRNRAAKAEAQAAHRKVTIDDLEK